MRIGFDAKRYFNNFTGLGNYSRWLINNLNDQIPQSIVLFHTKKQNEYNEDISVITPEIPLLKSIWRSWLIVRNLKKEKIDIYHGLSNELPFGIHKTSIKTVVTIHDLINKRYPENYAPIDRWIYDIKLRYAQKHADVIITVSEQTKKDIINYYKTDESKIRVIPIGISKKKTSTKKSDKPYILCVSSFTKRKNIRTLLEAFESIKSKKITLKVVGSHGNTSKEIIRLAKKDLRVELQFNVSNEKLNELYRNCEFCIYPSLFEGFGIPILEAFSFGKTIATSNISSMPEVGKNAAMYFDPKNHLSVRQAILQLMNQDIREEFEKKIPKTLQLFDSNKLIETYKSTYDELMTTI